MSDERSQVRPPAMMDPEGEISDLSVLLPPLQFDVHAVFVTRQRQSPVLDRGL
jgi:hypothetical protein